MSKVIKADIYPEFGTYPGGGESPIIPFGSEKNAEREVIHGRWAMLGVTGAWAAENGTGIPWFTAGTLCTPDDCTAVADKFPGAVAPLAPEGSGYPSFWAVLAIEVVLVGLAEAYRTGLSDPVFDELTVGDVSPGGRFDPLGLAESGDLEELKIKELKHCRLHVRVARLHHAGSRHPGGPHRQLAGARRGPRPRQRAHQRRLRLRLLLSGVPKLPPFVTENVVNQ